MVQYPIGSMVLLYMVTWIPSIYPLYVSIYTSTMDPMGFSNQMQLSLDSAAQPIVTVHGAEIWTICDMALEDTKATGATPVAYTKNALWNDAAHCPHLPTKASREGMEEGLTKIYSVVICRIHAHIHISTDWLWHAFDDVGTCWACFFPKENGSKPIPRKNGTRNPSSTATISNHWNPADLRWFIFPNRPTCKNLAGGTRPWRLRGSRTTMNKKWKNSLHLSASWRSSAQHKIQKKYLRSICHHHQLITATQLLNWAAWVFPKEEHGFPSQYMSSYDHMINYGIPWSPRMCLFAIFSWTSSCQEWTHRNLYTSRTSWSLIWTHIICCHVVKT